jgi:REP element-mobilizing transposase RayT
MPQEWNDTGIPLAYLITFRCYGTWLHGDERGSVNRFQKSYGTPYVSPNLKWNELNFNKLKLEPVKLNSQRRNAVEIALRENYEIRGWKISALNVRTNHVHIVISVGAKNPDQVLIALKANATRKMREDKCWNSENTPWAEKGSKRYLWSEKSVEKAIDYVINGQGKPLPDFNE